MIPNCIFIAFSMHIAGPDNGGRLFSPPAKAGADTAAGSPPPLSPAAIGVDSITAASFASPDRALFGRLSPSFGVGTQRLPSTVETPMSKGVLTALEMLLAEHDLNKRAAALQAIWYLAGTPRGAEVLGSSRAGAGRVGWGWG